MSASVRLREVSKRYGQVVAVDNVSLSIHAGEFLTLLGPSGCGKTTMLRLVAGFVAPDSGAVLIGDQDVTAVPPHQRDVNQVFQSYALFPHLSARDNIAFGLRMQRRPALQIDRRVREVVSLVALEGCEDRKPHQLSGGQQQRVALARALAPEPAVLLLDEPLSALDARLRQAMQIELKRLQRQIGTTFIFVTHDQEEALTMSDRIALVRAGRIEQCGDVQEIYHRPATTFAAEFVGQTNLFEAKVVNRDAATVLCRTESGLEFSVSAERWPKEEMTATLSIRPEKICVSQSQPARTNTFSAVIQEILFKGAVNRFVLLTDGGMRLNALMASGSAYSESLRIGERIQCAVHAEDIAIVLPRPP